MFAKEGEAARAKDDSSAGKTVAAPDDTQGAGGEIQADKKLWVTSEFSFDFCIDDHNKNLSVKSTVTTVSPMLRTSLMVLGDISNLTTIPGLNEAARMLLAVWEAVDTVEVNALIFLFLSL